MRTGPFGPLRRAADGIGALLRSLAADVAGEDIQLLPRGFGPCLGGPRPRRVQEQAADEEAVRRGCGMKGRKGPYPLLADPDCAVRGSMPLPRVWRRVPFRHLQHTTRTAEPPGPIGPHLGEAGFMTTVIALLDAVPACTTTDVAARPGSPRRTAAPWPSAATSAAGSSAVAPAGAVLRGGRAADGVGLRQPVRTEVVLHEFAELRRFGTAPRSGTGVRRQPDGAGRPRRPPGRRPGWAARTASRGHRRRHRRAAYLVRWRTASAARDAPALLSGRMAHVAPAVTELAESERERRRSEGARIVGTSLTPEFWERFVLLLFVAMGVTFALTMLFDALALRWLNRRGHRPPTRPTPAPDRFETKDHRTSVHGSGRA